MAELRTTFLEDGGQSASATVDVLTRWIDAATESLWVAIYDFDVVDPATATIARALGVRDAARHRCAGRLQPRAERGAQRPEADAVRSRGGRRAERADEARQR